MLHVLLMILKILGILLLVILGIVLFVILAVLLVPIRYSVSGEKYKEKSDKKETPDIQQEEETQIIKAKVVVSWLAHLVHFRFRLQNKEKEMELYLFGIPVFALKNKISEKRANSKKKPDAKADVKPQEEPIVEEPVIEESVIEEPVIEEPMAEEISQVEQEEPIQVEVPKENPIKKLFRTIKEIPQKIKAKIESIKLTIKKLCGKIKAGSDFLKNESTKATIRLIFGKLKNMIVHLLPRKIKGTVIFGFEDPALTGEVLGASSLFYPKYRKTLKLIPVFEQPIIEGKLKIKGRIVIGYLVWQAVKFVLDKNTRRTFKNVKKLIAEIKA